MIGRRRAALLIAVSASASNVAIVACGGAVPSAAPINDDEEAGSEARIDAFVATDGGSDADVVLPSYDAGPIAELAYDEHPYMFPTVCPYGFRLTYNLT